MIFKGNDQILIFENRIIINMEIMLALESSLEKGNIVVYSVGRL